MEPEVDRRGVVYGFAAYALWGLFPLYFPLLLPAGGLEIVAHRVLWSLVFVGILLTVLRRWMDVRALVVDGRQLLVLLGAAVLLAGNWLIFVHGVNSGHVVETSLGYFITPLVSVLLGVVVFGERLRRLQWTAVAVAALAVVVLTADYGRPPWIAFGLACTFGLYGMMKKLVRVDAAPGLFIETALLAVPAGGVLALVHQGGGGTLLEEGLGHSLLLASSGLVTAVPLLLFAVAARRIPLSTVGLLQYVAPLLMLGTGLFVYGEALPAARLAGFAIVWVALALFTADMLRHARLGSRRAAAETIPAGL